MIDFAPSSIRATRRESGRAEVAQATGGLEEDIEEEAGAMAYRYICSAHKPTNVTHSCVGNFTS